MFVCLRQLLGRYTHRIHIWPHTGADPAHGFWGCGMLACPTRTASTHYVFCVCLLRVWLWPATCLGGKGLLEGAGRQQGGLPIASLRHARL